MDAYVSYLVTSLTEDGLLFVSIARGRIACIHGPMAPDFLALQRRAVFFFRLRLVESCSFPDGGFDCYTTRC